MICRQRSGVVAIRRGTDATVQPGASSLPLPVDCRARDAERTSRLVGRQTSEEPQLRNPAFSQIKRRELGERRVQVEDIDVWRVALSDRFVYGDPRPPPDRLAVLRRLA